MTRPRPQLASGRGACRSARGRRERCGGRDPPLAQVHWRLAMPAPPTSRIRVLLIDDQELVRMGLRLLLERDPGMVVVGEAASRAGALAIAAREQPDIILLDLDLA